MDVVVLSDQNQDQDQNQKQASLLSLQILIQNGSRIRKHSLT